MYKVPVDVANQQWLSYSNDSMTAVEDVWYVICFSSSAIMNDSMKIDPIFDGCSNTKQGWVMWKADPHPPEIGPVQVR
jgi:hypothetical protein